MHGYMQVLFAHDEEHILVGEHKATDGWFDRHVRRYDVVVYHVKALEEWQYMYWTLADRAAELDG